MAHKILSINIITRKVECATWGQHGVGFSEKKKKVVGERERISLLSLLTSGELVS
jgi:hypothetical protein